jgi:flagellar basal body-associated protein FliL
MAVPFAVGGILWIIIVVLIVLLILGLLRGRL